MEDARDHQVVDQQLGGVLVQNWLHFADVEYHQRTLFLEAFHVSSPERSGHLGHQQRSVKISHSHCWGLSRKDC